MLYHVEKQFKFSPAQLPRNKNKLTSIMGIRVTEFLIIERYRVVAAASLSSEPGNNVTIS